MYRKFSIACNEFRYHQRIAASYPALGIVSERFWKVSRDLEIKCETLYPGWVKFSIFLKL